MNVCDKCKNQNNLSQIAILTASKNIFGIEETKKEIIATLCSKCRYDVINYIHK